MSTEKEGLGRLNAYTDLWIKKVFQDFYNLAMHTISPKMNKIQNQGFQKLLKHEMKTKNNQYIETIKHIENQQLAIFDVIKKCENQDLNTACFNDYFKGYMELINFMSLNMFEYGVAFGFEFKNNGSSEDFKW